MKDIVILGTGGCARELQWLIEDNNLSLSPDDQWNILGFVEPHAEEGSVVNGLPVLSDEWLFEQIGMNVACGLGEAKIRRRVVAKMIARNPSLEFPILISRRANISQRVEMGRGCIMCAGATVTCNIKMDEFVIINLGSIVTHDTVIGAFTQINPSTNISGGVRIGSDVQIGTGVKIIPHVTIGDRVILGAGAVVVDDIPNGCTAVGCPAKVIKRGPT